MSPGDPADPRLGPVVRGDLHDLRRDLSAALAGVQQDVVELQIELAKITGAASAASQARAANRWIFGTVVGIAVALAGLLVSLLK